MMRTGEQYLESLRDGRRVMCGGELIEDITSHPKTSGYASQVAEFYDLHLDPKHQEHLTYIDEDGVRRAKHWMMPKNKEQAVERREYFDYIFRHFRGGQWSRLPCSNNTVMMLLVDDPEPWEAQTVFGKGKPMADNIRRAWADLKDGDLAASPMFIDIQFDRSGSDHTDIPMLRMIEERDDGILVRGWKAVGTGTVSCHNMGFDEQEGFTSLIFASQGDTEVRSTGAGGHLLWQQLGQGAENHRSDAVAALAAGAERRREAHVDEGALGRRHLDRPVEAGVIGDGWIQRRAHRGIGARGGEGKDCVECTGDLG